MAYMKTHYLYLILLMVLLYSGCKKEEPATIPVVSTTSVSNVTGSTAKCEGNISSDGRSPIIERGVVYWIPDFGTSIKISDTFEGSGTGSFICAMDSLTGNTFYRVRAYATNSVGTAWGKDITFTTLALASTVTTRPATNISLSTAILNGIVNANNTATIVTFEYGITTSYGSKVTASESENPITGDSITNVSAYISGLTSGETYHFRIIAENSAGKVYSDDLTFKTLGSTAPVVSTKPATNISTTGATLNGSVNANGLSTVVTFEYDSSQTMYRNTVTAYQSPFDNDSIINVSGDITGLTRGVTYHFRVKAENSDGAVYGDDIQFTLFTCDQVPEVRTLEAKKVTTGTWTLYGTVNAHNLPTTVTFTYLRGVHMGRWNYQIVSAVPDTIAGDSITDVSASTVGFGRGPYTRTFWVSATNVCGTVKGNVLSFTLP
jgi:hypothetical protein